MDVFEAIRTFHSTRKYLDAPVEMGKIAEILEAGRLSQSAGNLQNWRFILVRDPEHRKSVAEACLQQHWMASAPVHIVVLAELKRIGEFYGLRGERLYAVQNCAVAIENMMLTAHALGLGCCWVGAFDETALATLLSVREQARPQAVITIGYPDPLEQKKIQPRYRIENIAWIEFYGNRVGDIGAVLWEFRYGERAAKAMQTLVSGAEKATSEQTSSWFEKLRKKGKELSSKMKKEEKETSEERPGHHGHK